MAGADNIKGYEFKPGQCGNPNGRPKGRASYTAILKRLAGTELKQEITDPFTGELRKITASELAALKLIEKMNKGDLSSIKEFADRTDGAIKQKHEHGQDPDAPFNATTKIQYIEPKKYDEPVEEIPVGVSDGNIG